MRKSLKTLLFSFALVLGLLIMMPAQEAKAAGLTTEKRTKTAITFSWEAPEDYEVTNYYIYVEKYSEADGYYWKKLQTLPGDQTSTTVKGLKAGTKYHFRVNYDWYGLSGTFYEDYSLSYGYLHTSLDKVKNVHQERWYYFALSFFAEWDEQSAADGYQYRVYNSAGKLKTKGLIEYNSESLNVNNIVNTQIYTVQVRAYKDIDGKRVYGEWSNKCYCFTQPRVTKASVAKNKLTVKWNKVNGATGYDVYVSTKAKTGYKKVKTVGKDTKSITISKFNGNKIQNKKKYYVYVVTRKKVNNKVHTSGRLYYWNTKENTDSFGYF